MTTQVRSLTRGDILEAKGFLYAHYGVYTGDNTVVHFDKSGRGVSHVNLEEFSRGRMTFAHWHEDPDSAELTAQRAEAAVGTKRYDLLSFNCEHFVTECALGRASSRQVGEAFCLGAIAGVLCLLSDRAS